MISVVVVSGSKRLNELVRIDCLWRCVRSMHDDPGLPFELIIIDNADADCTSHKKAIDEVFETFNTVTHVVRNKVNERYGGGAHQGALLADGDLIVFAADDTCYLPGWLAALVRPLTATSEKYLAALEKGPNVRSRLVRGFEIEGLPYKEISRAGAYCWAVRKSDYFDELGPWRRQHFADTKFANRAISLGFKFVVPEKSLLKHSNLNFLRPWEYGVERQPASVDKSKLIDSVWENGDVQSRPIDYEFQEFPRTNPDEQTRQGYTEEYLKKHASHLTDDERDKYRAVSIGLRPRRKS